jgi:flagellar biosynthesis protein FlhF
MRQDSIIHPVVGSTRTIPDSAARRTIEAALTSHGVVQSQIRKLVAASRPTEADVALDALLRGLTLLYRFEPLAAAKSGRFMLMGAPGSGKTLTLAKLASRAKALGRHVRLVSCDMARSGAVEQLKGFAAELDLTVEIAPGKAELAALGPTDGATILIDSGGINPYSPADRRNLEACAQAAKAEPILVLAAGGDAADTVEAAHCFRDIGCQRFIAARLDIVQRLGSLMAVPEALGLAFTEAVASPSPATGIAPLSPEHLAHLLLQRG